MCYMNVQIKAFWHQEFFVTDNIGCSDNLQSMMKISSTLYFRFNEFMHRGFYWIYRWPDATQTPMADLFAS